MTINDVGVICMMLVCVAIAIPCAVYLLIKKLVKNGSKGGKYKWIYENLEKCHRCENEDLCKKCTNSDYFSNDMQIMNNATRYTDRPKIHCPFFNKKEC